MKNSKLHTTEDKSNEKVTSSNSKSEDTEQYGRWRIHAKSVCSGYCPFHNPSNHPLKDAGINIRGDKMMLVERMCEHGIGHDDPDSVAYLQSKGEMWAGTHGCDGCCCEPPQDSPLGQVTSLTEITAEYFMATDPDRVALQRKVLAWHKAELGEMIDPAVEAIQQIIEARMIEFQSSLEEDYEQELLKARIDELNRYDTDEDMYKTLRTVYLQAKLKGDE